MNTNEIAAAMIADAFDASPAGTLDATLDFLTRFVSYPSHAASIAHALWVAHTHFMESWETTPRLAFLSPEPGSGKTRALEITELLVPSPMSAVNMSPAALFRMVGREDGLPTILFDEIDTVFGPKAKENEELRGLLNAGYRRGAKTYRCAVNGKKVEVEEIEAFSAVALAGLGNLPDTILTRSVIVRMKRRAPDEHVEPYRRRFHGMEGEALRERLQAWADGRDLSGRIPEMPDGIVDRDADVWEALIAVADEAGGHWPDRARKAAIELLEAAKEKSPSMGVQLLADMHKVFGDAAALATATIIERLHNLDESPWGDMNAKPLNNRGLSRRLSEYGIKPKQIRIGESTPRGYVREDFIDAWSRYLSLYPAGSKTSKTSKTYADEKGRNSGNVLDVLDVLEFPGKRETEAAPDNDRDIDAFIDKPV